MANAAVSAEANSGGISRREFLYYIWGASIALYAAQFSGLLVWFLLPKFREGEFGGKFTVDIDDLPPANAEPVNVPSGRFWLVNLDTTQENELMKKAEDEAGDIVGVAAIYKVCTHLGCIYTWTAANDRFECPCHGSKFRLDGRRIESPAPRALDRFRMEFLDADKNPIPGT
ncbi:MAG: ubiquinol-cytochrome c reductase iron-sulfur subunit, partial [Chloroflexi bacterium]|nr:ubiquinol-cytochrome c reductase iron-sulfur subunit [Chloroflexota bacterium]